MEAPGQERSGQSGDQPADREGCEHSGSGGDEREGKGAPPTATMPTAGAGRHQFPRSQLGCRRPSPPVDRSRPSAPAGLPVSVGRPGILRRAKDLDAASRPPTRRAWPVSGRNGMRCQSGRAPSASLSTVVVTNPRPCEFPRSRPHSLRRNRSRPTRLHEQDRRV